MLNAFIEGLAGVQEDGKLFQKVRLVPRWDFSGNHSATVVCHYPSSGAYCAYRYQKTGNRIILDVTGSGNAFDISVPISSNANDFKVWVNGIPARYLLETIETSRYLKIDQPVSGTSKVIIEF
jgi:hypothetical protein